MKNTRILELEGLAEKIISLELTLESVEDEEEKKGIEEKMKSLIEGSHLTGREMLWIDNYIMKYLLNR